MHDRALWRKKNLAWYLWDFGTQILLVNASVYFSLWLVVDQGVPDFWYSATFILSTIVLIFLSPYAGVLLDRQGGRARAFSLLTGLTLASGILIEAAGALGSFAWRVGLALALFACLNIFFQLACFIYNTFLKDISTRENVGRVSGIGAGASTLGDALGLLATLPIILGAVTLLGTSRVSVFAPAGVLAGLCCIPMYLAFRRTRDERGERISSGAYHEIWRDLRDTKRYPGVARLLIAFGLYNDAILTLQLFAAIYLDKVYRIGSSTLAGIIILVYVSVAAGAWAGGYVGDRAGYKRCLVWGLLSTAFVIGAIALGNPGPIVYVLFALFGIGVGVTNTNTKALFSDLIPYEKKGEFFGIYAIFERFASIIGPAAWGAVVYLAPSGGALNYRLAAAAMGAFLLLGAFVASRLDGYIIERAR